MTTALKTFLSKKIPWADISAWIDRLLTRPFFQKNIFLWIMAAGLSLVFVFRTIPYLNFRDIDAPSYYIASKGILQHVNIYDDQAFEQLVASEMGKAQIVYPYIYWPLLAQLFTPLTLLDLPAFFLVFQVLNILLAFLAVFLISRLLNLKSGGTTFPLMFLFLLLVENAPLLATISYGQVNLIVLDLVLGSLLLLRTNRYYLSSLLLVLAILVKIYPVLFLAVIFHHKKYKYIGFAVLNGLAVFGLSILLFGKSIWIAFVSFGLKTFSGTTRSLFTLHYIAHVNNNSIKSALLQLIPSDSPALLLLPLLTPLLLIALLGWLWAKKNALLRDQFNFGTSVILISALIVSPISWFHHYVILLFAIAYLLSRIVAEKRYGYLIPFVLCGSLILYPRLGGGFPFNQVRLMATLGFFGMLLSFAKKPSPNHNV